MFVEDLETLPESMREQFVEHELDGKKGFADKGSVALYNSMKNAKAEKEEYRNKYTESQTKLSEFEATQAEKIEAAKVKALEDAKNNKDVDAIEQRYQEQMADLEKRVREEERQNVTTEFAEKNANLKATSIADNIGLSLGIEKEDGEVIAELIRGRVKVDANTGKEIYHDAQGSALSVDKDGFIALIKKEKRFARLIKADFTTEGGGNANGSNNRGSAPNMNKEAEEAKKKGDVTAFLKAKLKQK